MNKLDECLRFTLLVSKELINTLHLVWTFSTDIFRSLFCSAAGVSGLIKLFHASNVADRYRLCLLF